MAFSDKFGFWERCLVSGDQRAARAVPCLSREQLQSFTLSSISPAPEVRWESQLSYDNVGPIVLALSRDDELLVAGATTAALDHRGVAGREVWAQLFYVNGSRASTPLEVGWSGDDQLHAASAGDSVVVLAGVSHAEEGDQLFVVGLERGAFPSP